MNLEIIEQNSFFSFPTNIHFGVGVRSKVVPALLEAHASKPLVVTDRGVAELPFFIDFVNSIEASGLKPVVYSEIYGNPVKSQVDLGVTTYKENQCDAVVAIGGGAALDVAKVIALMAYHPGDAFDYEDGKPDALPVDKKMPPIFALSTTSGTGSEVGRASVVSEDASKKKRIIFHPRLLPSQVFLDPELTVGLPAPITAATGLDALTHLIEAYLALGFNPMCDGIALQGIHLVATSLKECVKHAEQGTGAQADHLYHRGIMQMAACMGAVAFQKGLGVTHSCAHALSTVCDLHHGLANGILLPYCMEFNYEAVPQRFENMARATGQLEKGDEFVPWLVALKEDLKIPKTLSAAGVNQEHLPSLIDFALADGCHLSNPRPVSEDDFQKILTKALG